MLFAALGFEALATTSAGLAFSRGLPDTVDALPVEEVLAHVAEIVDATALPVSADLQDGYADTAEGVADTVTRCVALGVAGLSIEDASGDPDRPLYEIDRARDRVAAARAAIDASGADVVLTARAECFLVGHPDPLAASLRRLEAYAEAGADVLYAPGLPDLEAIAEVVKAAAPLPVNALVGSSKGWRVDDLAAIGVRRISVGSAIARAGWTAVRRAAAAIASEGRFDGFEGIASTGEISRWFGGGGS